MNDYFHQKNIWITGASSGIGRAIAKQLSTMSQVKLALSGRNIEALTQLKNELSCESMIVPFDVSNKQANQNAVNTIIENFGHIDIAFLNAGGGFTGDDNDFSKAYEEVFATNFFSVIYGIDALKNTFSKSRDPHIIITSSLSAFIPLPGSAAYSSSKAALLNATRAIRIEHEQDFKITTVYPGFVATPLIADTTFKKPFLVTAEKAASIILQQSAKQKAEIKFPWLFATAIHFMNMLPLAVYNLLARKMK